MYMTTELNLDITTYNINDIEKLFRFKSNSKYSQSDVELREYEIRQQLLSSGHINKKIERDIILFLSEAKRKLIDVKCKIDLPTSIPKDYKLDPDNYPVSETAPLREENIIEKTKTPFIYTQPGDYYPGILNPIEKRINTKLICIDTLFRSNYKDKSTDFIYTLPAYINNVVSMQLIASEIPHTWNSISKANQNNQMMIQINNVRATDGSGNLLGGYQNYQFTINIPDGNYVSTTFQTIINNILLNQTEDDNGTPTWALRFLTIVIEPISMSTIIRANNSMVDSISGNALPCPYESTNPYYSPEFEFTVTFNIASDPTRPIYQNLGWILGFRNSIYNVNVTNDYTSYIDSNAGAVRYKGYLKSESSFTSAIDNYIFLEIDDYHNNFPTDTIISANGVKSSYLGKNIMARITLTSDSNTIMDGNISDMIFKKREYFGPVKIEKMRIRLLNRFGNVIDLKQNDYSFVLELKQLYNN